MRGPVVQQRVRRWLLPSGVVLALVLVLWAGGGLRTVQATEGRPAAVEQEITLARWLLVVHRVELVNRDSYDTETPPTVRLHLRATFLGEASIYGLDTGIIAVEAPGGSIDSEAPSTDGDRRGGFDPGVAQEISLAYTWADAPALAPARIRVLIRDEELKENYLFGPSWKVEPGVATHVDVACSDQRMPR